MLPASSPLSAASRPEETEAHSRQNRSRDGGTDMLRRAESVLRDIYDAWRAQDLDQVASYFPEEFSHTVCIPTEVHPLGGLRTGKSSAMERLRLIAADFDFLKFDTSRR